jgi:DMSO/TMAO reductase YedYZ molybdopterin-dependent catalytic subunit
VVRWQGVRFVDFVRRFSLGTRSGAPADPYGAPADLWPYVGLATPDEAYFVGLDVASALHPQTLLCTRMNGAPLAAENGAPVRLVIPSKYGIKNIKRIGIVRFGPTRPPDYWAQRGYDWYAGL